MGKSALAVLDFGGKSPPPDDFQSVVVNLRQLPDLGLTLEMVLGERMSVLLSELSAPQRVLVIDAADAVAEDREDVFRYLVGAAQQTDVKVVAVTATDTKKTVLDILGQHYDTDVAEFNVPPLTDAEIERLIGTFSQLGRLFADPRSRELLRRLVVVDLLVRAGFRARRLAKWTP